MCKRGLGQDQPINKEDVAIWDGCVELARSVDVFKIPKCLFKKKEDVGEMEFHVIFDA